ncbi:disease resistance protein RPP4-like [Pistacia vera]|uniref:disease resistance protein RPP4-like n=1 Tax=Pistacia vera TaxID=55513 RepID=UPI001263874B|nr:disease resistance protein RPP4-like [Pistacia vera]
MTAFPINLKVAALLQISERFLKNLVHLLYESNFFLKLLREKNINPLDIHRGIYRRLQHKRVLIVLDDVNELEQLETLAGDREWFGPGSRIIITTRDEHLLIAHFVKIKIYRAKDLVSKEALQLFILGSYVCGRSVNEWRSALKKLKEILDRKVFDVLKISYDGLEETVKNIFLDIACFFHLRKVTLVTEILEACGFYPETGV